MEKDLLQTLLKPLRPYKFTCLRYVMSAAAKTWITGDALTVSGEKCLKHTLRRINWFASRNVLLFHGLEAFLQTSP